MLPKRSISLLLLYVAVFLLSAFETNTNFKVIKGFEVYKEQIYGSDQTILMQPITGGSFIMGNDNGKASEQPAHKVQVGDFWMSAYEITWDQYQLFAERQIDDAINPEMSKEVDISIDAVAAATAPYVDMSHGMGRKGYPVVNITEHAALTFCKWLTAKTGKFYRLPTEAEWEYACRAGGKAFYSFGKDSTQLGEYAWYKANSDNKYQKVGTKKPNAFGLFDMHGNVAELTMDQYTELTYANRNKEQSLNPWVRPTELYPRVVRGGSWRDDASELGAASRIGSKAAWKRIDPQIPKSRWWFTNASHVGFRIIRPRITPSKEDIDKYWLEAIDDY
ncbi:formylglycine-generating enzyme family protein [Muriicola sp. Z0-33]|uniref:formylglycine-generating enzyme family protein n=1 Tax=Muriicola sp. Z0-33 TaxID=2816957 RepID=UPI0022382E08|nr:formylglycine-generating enzyme family protein [Muriicola sp. Z0-33]MCW5514882.1 SUMF1/EgtB/PvdO family nonheme iron enzyme [Muriicola sp. Z0-33]